ncbi:MAG: hypothetical protein RL514_1873 [Verrucomicrobiota bacterium]|jgi:hypothetical protein
MKKPIKLGLWLLGFALLAVVGLWLEHERVQARIHSALDSRTSRA